MRKGAKIALGVAGTAAAVAAIAAVAGGGEAPEPEKWEPTGIPQPIAQGPANDPEIAALLAEMRDEFASAGVNLNWITPEEVTRLRKLGVHAIPPRRYWPRMIQTIRAAFEPIRAAFGKPITITNGYRTPEYNRRDDVKGKPRSRHQWFEALDMIPEGGASDDRRELASIAAALFVAEADELQMGLGIYPPESSPGGVHIDTGHNRRTWADTKKWLAVA